MSGTFTLSENQSTDSLGKTSANASSVELKVEFVAPPERAVLTQCSSDGEMLSSLAVTPDDIPDSIAPEPGCAYIVAATFSDDETSYELFTPDSDPWLFRPIGDTGVCEKKSIVIDW